MEYQSAPVGNRILAELFFDNPDLLLNNDYLERIATESLECDNFGILGKLRHDFEPQGLTLLFLLKESHLAIHTYPEHSSLDWELYSCRGEGDGRKAFNYFVNQTQPSLVTDGKDNRVVVDLKTALEEDLLDYYEYD